MRRFILHTSIFACIIICLVIGFQLFLTHNPGAVFKMPEKVNTIFFGNSTIECSINDNLAENIYNMGKSSDRLDLIYAKLQLLKEYNANIDTVYLGFDDIILYKQTIDNPEIVSPYFLSKFSFNDYMESLSGYKWSNTTDFFSHFYDFSKIRPLLLSNLSKTMPNNLGIGGYLNLKRDKLEIDLEKRKKSDSQIKKIEDFPTVSKYYLNRIIDFSKQNGITLIFLNSPKHNGVETDTVYREIHRRYFSNIPLIDDMNLAMSDSCFGDCYHLNYRGALVYTEKFIQQIEEK